MFPNWDFWYPNTYTIWQTCLVHFGRFPFHTASVAWDKVEHVKVLIGHAEASELRIENSALRKGPQRDHVRRAVRRCQILEILVYVHRRAARIYSCGRIKKRVKIF
jgi:ABC-type enterochelin transport system ATPase subunit